MTKESFKRIISKHFKDKFTEEQLNKAYENLFKEPIPQNESPYAYDVDMWEILPEEQDKPYGERLTKLNCKVCQKALSEAHLADIRRAFAPFQHYKCFIESK